MTVRLITSHFSARCAVCRKPYDKGEQVYYDAALPRGSKVWHLACHDMHTQPQPAPSMPATPPSAPYRPSPSPHPAGAWPIKVHRQVFGSVDECVDFAKTPNPLNREHWDLTESGASTRPSSTWYGIAGGVNAVKALLAAGTWPDGTARMLAALGDIGADLPQPRSVRRARVRRDFGAEVDVTEYWRGRGDQAWQHCVRASRHGPQVVTVAFNMAISASQHSDNLFWRGAAALCLADKLTTAGYNVEIIGIECGTNVSDDGKRHGVIEILVKPATAPLDLNALSLTACFAGFFRFTLFHVMQAFPFEVALGLGHACTYRHLISEEADPRTLFIADGEQCETAQGARAWIEQSIATLERGMAQQQAA